MLQKPNIDMSGVGEYKQSSFGNNVNIKTNNDVFLKNKINEYEEMDYSNTSSYYNFLNPTLNNNLENNLNLWPELADFIKKNKLSDVEEINATKFGSITNYIENLGLNNKQLNKLTDYLEGKKIADLLDENGYFKPIENNGKFDSETLEKINNKLVNQKFIIDESCLDYTIEEFVCDDSGYNALVLKDDNGNYMISSSPTNEESSEDKSVILYTMINYIYGDDALANYLSPSILNILGMSGDVCAKDLYNSQIDACYDLIKKYTEKSKLEGNRVNLSGYSLGGGITLAAYSLFSEKEKEIKNNIFSVSVYNPYMQYINETFNDSVSDVLEFFQGDGKLSIYCSEGDLVSTFNDYIPALKDKITFLPAYEITKKLEIIDIGTEKITVSMSLVSDLYNILNDDGSNPEKINESIYNLAKKTNISSDILFKLIKNPDIIKDIVTNNKNLYYDILVKGEGTHRYVFDNNIFDSEGNLKKTGNYVNINELIGYITGREYNGDEVSPDLDFILQSSVNGIFGIPPELIIKFWGMKSDVNITSFDIPLGVVTDNNNINGIDISKLNLKPVLQVLYNPNEYSSSKLIDAFAKSLSDWLATDDVKKYLKKEINNDAISVLLDNVSDKQLKTLVNSFASIIKDEDNYELTMQMLFNFVNGYETDAMKILIDELIAPNLLFVVQENMNSLKEIVCNLILENVSDKGIEILWIDTNVSLRDCLSPIINSVMDDLASNLNNSLNNSILNDLLSMAKNKKLDLNKMDKIVDQLAENNDIKPSFLLFELPNSLDYFIGVYWACRGVVDFICDVEDLFNDWF